MKIILCKDVCPAGFRVQLPGSLTNGIAYRDGTTSRNLAQNEHLIRDYIAIAIVLRKCALVHFHCETIVDRGWTF